MKYADIKFNDVANCPGVAVSFYTQGCPHLCPGCHNPETWVFNGGKEFTQETMDSILQGLTANNIQRSLCILGGEPLCPENEFLTYLVISTVKKKLPETKIYIWTGYLYEDLLSSGRQRINQIFELSNCLIDGPYMKELRDITLPMRGSSNQRVIQLKRDE